MSESIVTLVTPPRQHRASPFALQSTFPPHVSLAMMYVPYQRFDNLYEPEKALERGTLFAELDLPFYGGKRGNAK